MGDHFFDFWRGTRCDNSYFGMLILEDPEYFVSKWLPDGGDVRKVQKYLLESVKPRQDSLGLRMRH